MKLTHETEQGRKEVGSAKGGMDKKAPMVDGLEDGPGVGRMTRRVALVTSLVAAIAFVGLKSGCTFQSIGLESVDSGGETDAIADAMDVGADVEVGDGGHDADVREDGGHDADIWTDADVGRDGDVGLDADGDASHDADAADVGTDADVEVGPDADVGVDADTGDGGHDADVGVDADTGVDASTDADVVDSGVDAEVDGGPVACSAASTGTFNAYMPASTPTAVGGYIFTYSGINGLGNATIGITCGGSPVTVPANGFPILSETILVPNGGADGKRIRVTPNSGNSLGTDISVTVENL